MLDAFRKKSSGGADKALDSLEKGLQMLNGRMFKQAMIQFEEAVKFNPEVLLPRLREEFDAVVGKENYDAGLSIGLILVKNFPKDYKLANQVGNCARRQKNFKQANNLYRHALKSNNSYTTAFYNLAASMGKVNKYDDDVRTAIEKFANQGGYLLPDYQLDPQTEVKIKAKVKAALEDRLLLKKQELSRAISKAELAQELVEQKGLLLELKKLNETPVEPSNETIYKGFLKEIELAEAQAEPSLKKMAGTRMNLVIYALSQLDAKMAMQQLKLMEQKGLEAEFQAMCKAIAVDLLGDWEAAAELFMGLLADDPNNRFYNINLGLLYKQHNNRLLAAKYQAIGAALLEKSDGIYRLSELIQIAHQAYDDGDSAKALKLYQLVCAEVEDSDSLMKLGELYLAQESLDEATQSFQRGLKSDPDHAGAKDKLKEVHDIFYDKADAFFRDNKYKASAGVFEKALAVLRAPETVRKTASVYQVLRQPLRAERLMAEYEVYKQGEKAIQEEKDRQSNILLGRAYLQKKHWSKAIEHFEIAFRMKLDKDVFMFLATIYKKLRKTEEMKDLLNRWNRMTEHEEKTKKFS